MNEKIKLTKNESIQFNSLINRGNSLDSINPHRRAIKFKIINNLYLSDVSNNFNSIKKNKSNINIKFPTIKKYVYNSIVHNSKSFENNISFMNINPTTPTSVNQKSNRKIKNTYLDYVNLNSLFKYPKKHNKEKISLKFNYSNSINDKDKRKLLFEKRMKTFKYNFPKNIESNQIHPIKLTTINLKKKDDLFDIKNYMKMKYYEDVNKIMKKKLKYDSFFDLKDRDKLIKIGEFKIFWKNVLDFCGSCILSTKIKNKLKEIKNSSEENKSKIAQKKIPSNRIYTSIYRSKVLHYKNNI